MPTRVVVAEDEAIIRMDLRELREEDGYEVVAECGRGDEAVGVHHDAAAAVGRERGLHLRAVGDLVLAALAEDHDDEHDEADEHRRRGDDRDEPVALGDPLLLGTQGQGRLACIFAP